jgi:hypothetical protein
MAALIIVDHGSSGGLSTGGALIWFSFRFVWRYRTKDINFREMARLPCNTLPFEREDAGMNRCAGDVA